MNRKTVEEKTRCHYEERENNTERTKDNLTTQKFI